MATIRVRKTKDFSIVSNAVLRDKRLSLRTRGLLVFCLSLSDTWEYSIKGLAATTGESEGKIGNCLKELEATGYLTRTRIRDKKGRMMSVNYTLWENPQAQESDTQPNENPNVDYPSLENPNVDYPSLENQAQINTNLKKYQSKKYKPKQTQIHTNACACEGKTNLQPIPFEAPAKAEQRKRSALTGNPPLDGEQEKTALEWFERFWNAYPKKQNKVEARLAWLRLRYDVQLYIQIVEAVQRFRVVRRDWQTAGGRYVPMPENFLINERWNDEVKAETVQFDRPMDIALMAGMIVNEGRRQQNAEWQGYTGRVDCVEGRRTDTAQSAVGTGRLEAVNADDTIDVAAIWTP